MRKRAGCGWVFDIQQFEERVLRQCPLVQVRLDLLFTACRLSKGTSHFGCLQLATVWIPDSLCSILEERRPASLLLLVLKQASVQELEQRSLRKRSSPSLFLGCLVSFVLLPWHPPCFIMLSQTFRSLLGSFERIEEKRD